MGAGGTSLLPCAQNSSPRPSVSFPIKGLLCSHRTLCVALAQPTRQEITAPMQSQRRKAPRRHRWRTYTSPSVMGCTVSVFLKVRPKTDVESVASLPPFVQGLWPNAPDARSLPACDRILRREALLGEGLSGLREPQARVLKTRGHGQESESF